MTSARISLAALAAAKKLPVKFLRDLGLEDLPGSGVAIPYYDATGEPLAAKRRTALAAKDGSFWEKDKPVAAYGQWRLDDAQRAGFLILVEGESDCWALWHHGLPALGLPGSGTAKTLQAEHIEGLQRVYVSREPDQGGKTFVAAVAARLTQLGFRGKAFELACPDGLKDPAELHAADPDRFKARLEQAIRESTPLPTGATPHERNGHAATVKAPEPDPWRPPIALSEVPAAEPFPVEVLPVGLRRYVGEVAWSTNSPIDFAALPLLAVAGGAIGNSARLLITRTHQQGAVLFVATIGQPGSGKSPALELVLEPLELAERRYAREWKDAVKAWGREDEQARGDRPTQRRCLLDSTTTEAAVGKLGENPRGLLMARDELAGLIAGMNQYKRGQGDDRQTYLQLWGQATIRSDRKSNPDHAPVFVYRPFLGIVGTIQPAVVERLRGDRARGNTPPDDGFLDRFLFAFPAEPPAAGEQWREVSDEARQTWERAVSVLLEREMIAEEDGTQRPRFIDLNSSGRSAWTRFTELHAGELNGEDFPAHLRGAWAKLRGYCGRLALVLHFLRVACEEIDGGQVDGESVDRAARLVAYFKSHARKVYAAMDADARVADARRVLACLARNQELNDFTRRDLFLHLRGRGQRPESLDAPLRLLVEHRYLQVEARNRAGKPGPNPDRYLVNPLWDRQVCAQITQDTQDRPSGAPSPTDPVYFVQCVRTSGESDEPGVFKVGVPPSTVRGDAWEGDGQS